MMTPTPSLPETPIPGLALAIRFHETYERLAPSFVYETRTERRQLDPTTPNGKLMIAVCAEVVAAFEAMQIRLEQWECHSHPWGESEPVTDPEKVRALTDAALAASEAAHEQLRQRFILANEERERQHARADEAEAARRGVEQALAELVRQEDMVRGTLPDKRNMLDTIDEQRAAWKYARRLVRALPQSAGPKGGEG